MYEIAVIVPVYNVEAYLNRCLDSILKQSFMDFLLILVDDGSFDKSGEICEQYACLDKRIKVIHQNNQGLSAARNRGIEWVLDNTACEWITFIDSDDWVHKDYLKALYSGVLKAQVDICACCYRETGNVMIEDKDIQDCFLDQVCVISPDDFMCLDNKYVGKISVWAKIYNIRLFREIRFPVGKIFEDLYITHKLLFSCEKISFFEEDLYYYFLSPKSITRKEWTPRKLDEIQGFDEYIDFFEKSNHEKVLEFARRSYIESLIRQWKETSQEKKYRKYSRMIQKRLRRALYDYKQANKISFKSHKYMYEAAYPHLLKAYWYIICILYKLRGRGDFNGTC